MRHKSYNNVCIKEIDFSYITKHKSLNDMFLYAAFRICYREKRIVIKSHKNCIFRINPFLYPSCLWLNQAGFIFDACIFFWVIYCILFMSLLFLCNGKRETIQTDHNLYVTIDFYYFLNETRWFCLQFGFGELHLHSMKGWMLVELSTRVIFH